MTALDRYSSNTAVTQNSLVTARQDLDTISEYAKLQEGDDSSLDQNEVKMLVADMLGVDEENAEVTEVIQEIVQYLNQQTDLGPGLTVDNFKVPDYILADLLDMDGDGDLDEDDKAGLTAADGSSNGSTNTFVDNSTGYSATDDGIDYDQDGKIDITQDEATLDGVNSWLDSGGMIDLDKMPDGIQDSMDIILNADSNERLEAVHKIMYALVMIGVTDDALEEFYNQVVGNDGVVNSPSSVQDPINTLTSALRGKDDVRQQASVVSERFGDDSHWENEEGVMAANAREAMTSSSPSPSPAPAGTPGTYEDLSADSTPVDSGDIGDVPSTDMAMASEQNAIDLASGPGGADRLTNYLLTGDSDTTSADGASPIAGDTLARLANFFTQMFGIPEAEGKDIVAAMASEGMTTNQIVTMLDGGATGASNGETVKYSNNNNGDTPHDVGDGEIGKEEAAFGLNAFTREYNSTNADGDADLTGADTNRAAFQNDAGENAIVWASESAVPRSPDEQANYDALIGSITDNAAPVSEVEKFLEAAEGNGELSERRAIRDLLEIMGVTSEDGTALSVSDPIITNLYDAHSGDLSELANTLAQDGNVTPASVEAYITPIAEDESNNVNSNQMKYSGQTATSESTPPVASDTSPAPAQDTSTENTSLNTNPDADIGSLGDSEYIKLPAKGNVDPNTITATAHNQINLTTIQNNPGHLENFLTTGEETDSSSSLDRDQPISDSPAVMNRLAGFLSKHFPDVNTAHAAEIVAAMANEGMSTNQVLSLLDGGATGADMNADPKEDVSYKLDNGNAVSGKAGDGKVTKQEAAFGINSFVNEYNASNDTSDGSNAINGVGIANKAIHGDPATTVTAGEGNVPRSAAEQKNYDVLVGQMEDGIADVKDVERFLDAAEGGDRSEQAKKRAIRDLLEIMGVTSEDGTGLAVGDPFIEVLFEKYTTGSNSDFSNLAQDLSHMENDDNGGAHAGGTITKESAMANLRDTLIEEKGRHSLNDNVINNQIKFSVEGYEDINVPTIQNMGQLVNFLSVGDAQVELDTLNENQKNQLEAFVAMTAGVPAEDAEAIVTQMTEDGMNLEQLYDTMNGGRIMGQSGNGRNNDTAIDYGDGNAVDAQSSNYIRSGEARWGLADYVESRQKDEDATGLDNVYIDAPDAQIADSVKTNTGNAALGTEQNETGTIAAGGGQEVIDQAMNAEYQKLLNNNGSVKENAVSHTALAQIWNQAGNNESEQRTALTLILDVVGIETSSGMPLDIHDPLVTALLEKGGTGNNKFDNIMDYLVNGEVGSEDGPPTGTGPLNLDTMKHNANMLFADDTIDLSETEVAMGADDIGAQYYEDKSVDINAAAAASTPDDFLALFDGADMETPLDANDEEAVKSFLVGFAGVNADDAGKLASTIVTADPALDINTLYEYFDGGASAMDHGTEVDYGDGKKGIVGDGEISQEEVKFALSKIAADAGGSPPVVIDGAPETAKGIRGDDDNVTASPTSKALPLDGLMADSTEVTNISSSITDTDNSTDSRAVFGNFVLNGGAPDTESLDSIDTPLDELDVRQRNRLADVIAESTTLPLADVRQYIDAMLELTPEAPSLSQIFNMIDGRTYSEDPDPTWGGGNSTVDANDSQAVLDSMDSFITAKGGTVPT